MPTTPDWQRHSEKVFTFWAPPGFQRVAADTTLESARLADEQGVLQVAYVNAPSRMRVEFHVYVGAPPEIGREMSLVPVRIANQEGLLTAQRWAWLHLFGSAECHSALTVPLGPRRPNGSGRIFVATVTYQSPFDQPTAHTILRSIQWEPAAYTAALPRQ